MNKPNSAPMMERLSCMERIPEVVLGFGLGPLTSQITNDELSVEQVLYRPSVVGR